MANYATVLGMDPITFFLAVVSCLGLALSTLTLLRTYAKLAYAAQSVAQTRALYESLENDGLFPSEARRIIDLGGDLDKLEDEINDLMVDYHPTWNVLKKLRTWIRGWKLLFDVDRLRVELQTIFYQRRRFERAQRQGVVAANREQHTAHAPERIIFYLPVYDTASDVLMHDLDMNAGRLVREGNADEGNSASGYIPPIHVDSAGVIQMPAKAYQPPPPFNAPWRSSGSSRNSQSLLPTYT